MLASGNVAGDGVQLRIVQEIGDSQFVGGVVHRFRFPLAKKGFSGAVQQQEPAVGGKSQDRCAGFVHDLP